MTVYDAPHVHPPAGDAERSAACTGRRDGAAAIRDLRNPKGTLPLTEEQRKEADRLLLEARRAAAGGNFASALRTLHQGMAVMRGVEWSPLVEAAAALEVKPDHAIGRRPRASAFISSLSYTQVTASTDSSCWPRWCCLPPGVAVPERSCWPERSRLRRAAQPLTPRCPRRRILLPGDTAHRARG